MKNPVFRDGDFFAGVWVQIIFGKKETTMKRIEAIIRPTRAGRVCAALGKIGHPGPGISQLEDKSQTDTGYLLRGATYRVDYATKSRIEVIAEDGEAGMIVDTIREAAFTGEPGDGEIFVYAMEDAVRIRSGSRETAI
jgi:nitrogen regulatory protein P-II 1